jgi:hypothetical protein
VPSRFSPGDGCKL